MIDVAQLRRGLYVQLDLGWMDHPFPKGSFKITSDDQIRTIRTLGLTQVRYFPTRSDPVDKDAEGSPSDTRTHGPVDLGLSAQAAQQRLLTEADALRDQRREQLLAQQRSLALCERRFDEATRLYHRVLTEASAKPIAARDECITLVTTCVGEILMDGEAAIRLLSETNGDRSAMHPVNVMVISLLLGKALGLPSQDLAELGVAALLHDIGKEQLPERMRALDESFTASEIEVYREHVHHSVKAGKRMGLSETALAAIAEHHEMADGSGFPAVLKGPQMSVAGRILSLVNKYDRLCNPARLVNSMTPHEALSIMFANQKSRFDAVALGAFIRMMGVYPPGSVVQLVNERYAIVVSVNSTRPLKPRVIVHDASVPREEALILDLERTPELGIRRSLKPAQLPKAALEYLAPRQRVSYFYERPGQQPPAEAMA
jgi:putative nucleotidyltransferase with HDIG domain